jgi:uncharacterized protein YoxC
MKLLKYEGYNVTFEPEILTLNVFKKLYQRDRTKDKSKFIQELGFIYFYVDPRSDYQYITDPEDRIKAIVEGQGLSNNWTIDKTLQEAIDYYKTFSPTSALLLEDTRVAVDKLRSMLRNINLEETDDKGRPLYTLNTIVATIKQVPALVKDLDEAERTIAKEIVQNDKVRGSVEKAMYEDL